PAATPTQSSGASPAGAGHGGPRRRPESPPRSSHSRRRRGSPVSMAGRGARGGAGRCPTQYRVSRADSPGTSRARVDVDRSAVTVPLLRVSLRRVHGALPGGVGRVEWIDVDVDL